MRVMPHAHTVMSSFEVCVGATFTRADPKIAQQTSGLSRSMSPKRHGVSNSDQTKVAENLYGKNSKILRIRTFFKSCLRDKYAPYIRMPASWKI